MENNYLNKIQHILKAATSEKVLKSQKKFVPGLNNAYGVPMPVLNEIAKNYKSGSFELVEALWKEGALEERILAAKLLGKIALKDAAKTLRLAEQFSAEITNWAVCDAIGMQSLKPLVKKYSNEIFSLARKLNISQNLWQLRLSLVMVEWYTRDEGRHIEINKLISALENDKEYYVKKAVV